jgi:hypothetical protein
MKEQERKKIDGDTKGEKESIVLCSIVKNFFDYFTE